jgi:hypothetical protein
VYCRKEVSLIQERSTDTRVLPESGQLFQKCGKTHKRSVYFREELSDLQKNGHCNLEKRLVYFGKMVSVLGWERSPG